VLQEYYFFISVIFQLCRNSTLTFPFGQARNLGKYRVFRFAATGEC